MVAMVDRLVKAGLAVREPSETDRRVKRVVLTEAGHRMYDKVKTEGTALRRELLDRFDRGRLAAATEVLEELQRLIDAGT
jgi:MarR family transcriptional regulator for hemolysin